MKHTTGGALIAAALLSAPAHAQPVKPALAGLTFLIGNWSAGRGHVVETGGTSTGSSTIAAAAGGAILLRRDHTSLFDAAGHAAGSFEQIMTIYAEANTIRGDDFDPDHVIHYTRAVVQPGHSVVFTTTPAPGAPAFRLSYTLQAPDRLAVSFSVAPPGTNRFNLIADGALTKPKR